MSKGVKRKKYLSFYKKKYHNKLTIIFSVITC
jgi:hypothetical protein